MPAEGYQRSCFSPYTISCQRVTSPGVASGDRIYLDREDRIVEQLHMPQMQTSWSLLYRAMKNALPSP